MTLSFLIRVWLCPKEENPKVADTNLGKAEGHRIRVVILRDKNGSHKVSEFVAQTIYHHNQQDQTGNQGLQRMMR